MPACSPIVPKLYFFITGTCSCCCISLSPANCYFHRHVMLIQTCISSPPHWSDWPSSVLSADSERALRACMCSCLNSAPELLFAQISAIYRFVLYRWFRRTSPYWSHDRSMWVPRRDERRWMCVSACSSACRTSTISATPSGSNVEWDTGRYYWSETPGTCPISVLRGRNKPAILSRCFVLHFVLVVSEPRCAFVSTLPTDWQVHNVVDFRPALLRKVR